MVSKLEMELERILGRSKAKRLRQAYETDRTKDDRLLSGDDPAYVDPHVKVVMDSMGRNPTTLEMIEPLGNDDRIFLDWILSSINEKDFIKKADGNYQIRYLNYQDYISDVEYKQIEQIKF
jgi:hypothetical protein